VPAISHTNQTPDLLMPENLTAKSSPRATALPHALPPQTSSTISLASQSVSLPRHGYWGVAILCIGEILMFAKVEPFYTWFTPIQWTGYVLLLDAILQRRRGESFIFDRTREFLLLLIVSKICCFLFEAYNLHLRNWEYHHLPENMALRLTGFFWAFASIFPGILMTSDVIDEFSIFRKARFSPLRVPKWIHRVLLITGALFCTVPVLVPAEIAKYLFAFVWVGFVFLLDPINYRSACRRCCANSRREASRSSSRFFSPD
jgi:hypothetical protein